MKYKKSNSHLCSLDKYKTFHSSKRSQAHVEMMISFVLFVGALIAIYVFLNPLSQSQEKINVINDVHTRILKNLSSSVSKLSIIINTTRDYYQFNLRDYVDTTNNPNIHYVEIMDPLNPRRYIIYISDTFPENISTRKLTEIECVLKPCSYSIGSYTVEDIIFYEKILTLKNTYELDYGELKKSLGIVDDFLFKFKTLDGDEVTELSVSKKSPTGVQRYADEIPVRVINYSGNIQELILNINAW